MSYRSHALRGISWYTLVKVYAKALTVAKIIILARVLSPADLGVFGLAAILILLAEVFTETGINTFLIQNKDPISKYLNTAWVTSIVRGLIIGGILAALAWPLSVFYADSSLLALILGASLVPVMRGFINPSVILWQKELSFRKEALFRALLFSVELGVGIPLAFAWKNPLGLMVGILVSAAVETALTHLLIAPRPQLQWNVQRFREVFGFGRWHNLNTIFAFLGQTTDDMIVGKILGSGNLGYYQTAFNIAQTSTNDLSDSVASSMYPIYARLHDDVPRLKKAVVFSILPTALLLAAGCVVIVLLAEPAIRIALGEQWLPVIPALPWMLAAGWIQAINSLIYPLYLVKGEPKQQLPMHVWYWVFLIVLMIPLSTLNGLTGAAMTLFFARLFVQPLVAMRLRTFWKRWSS